MGAGSDYMNDSDDSDDAAKQRQIESIKRQIEIERAKENPNQAKIERLQRALDALQA